jgi:hypothetical protein
MRIAIILYCLLSAIIDVSAAENVTPGKYFCVVSDAVGLQTNASTHQRYGGAIDLPPERQKFFITIEETKPLVSEELYQNYCFGDDAIQALKGLRLGQPVNVLDIKTGGHTFLSLDEYFRACQARYVLKFSGELSKIETDKYSDNTNLFHDRFTRFWITIDQKFLWHFDNSSGDHHYMAEGVCEKN